MRAYTPGGRGCKAQGVRHTRRGEGVAVGGSRCRCCGCLDGGEVVRGGVVLFRNDEEKNKIIRIKVLKYLVSTNKSTTFAVFK